MTIKEALEYLEYYQYEYRRGEVSIRDIDPEKLGKVLDIAIEVLRKHPSLTHKQDFFREVEVPPLMARSPKKVIPPCINFKFIIRSDNDIQRLAEKWYEIGCFLEYKTNEHPSFVLNECLATKEYPLYVAFLDCGSVKIFPNEKEWLECSYLYLE